MGVKSPQLNMKVLRPSRTRIRPGDIFVFQILEHVFHFGMVIRTDVKLMGDDNILVYIYRAISPSKEGIPQLSKDKLLIPPQIVHRLMWTRGYFEKVGRLTLAEKDVLATHCFFEPLQKKYYDEFGRLLPQRSEPCGFHALSLEGAVDDKISDALGFPRCDASRQYDKELKERQEKARAQHNRNVQELAKDPKTAEILRKYGVIKDDDVLD